MTTTPADGHEHQVARARLVPTPPPTPGPPPPPEILPASMRSAPPPGFGYAPQRATTNGVATAALVLGLVSILINTLLVVGILAMILGARGVGRANGLLAAGYAPKGKGAATAGIALGAAGTLLSLMLKPGALFLV